MYRIQQDLVYQPPPPLVRSEDREPRHKVGPRRKGQRAVAAAVRDYRIERFPVTKVDTALRSVVKKAIGFRDADAAAR